MAQKNVADTNSETFLESVAVDNDLIEDLFKHKLISDAARIYALNLISQSKNWGAWASRLLLIIGTTLILSGIICFFAFNWVKISPFMKLTSIQVALFGCISGSYFYGLQHSLGKMLLLSASVLIGVFLAVFGQIYQTGADAYTLFMMWAALMLPFVLISEFAAQWALWIVVCNIFLATYLPQIIMHQGEPLTYLALFNGIFWGLREYFSEKGLSWLQSRWTRYMLISAVLSCIMLPAYAFIDRIDFSILLQIFGLPQTRWILTKPTYFSLLSFILSIVIHSIFYVRYRFKLPDMHALAITAFSFCIVLELILYQIISTFIASGSLTMLIQSVITFLLFVFLFYMLRDTKRNNGGQA